MAHARDTAAHLASHLLAAAVGHWVWTHREAVGAGAGAAALAATTTVRGHLEWFMGAKPLGVKLHIQLAQALGWTGVRYCDALLAALSALPPELLEAAAAAAAVALPLLGTGRALAAGAAAAAAAAYPVTLAYISMKTLYKIHLGATAGLWAAMRGRGSLPLPFLATPAPAAHPTSPRSGKRCRPPPDPTILAVAALLFMPFLLTLPTTAWFYFYFLALHALCTGAALCLRLLGTGRLPQPLLPALEQAQRAAAGRPIWLIPPKSYLSS